jgi:hypothetical protein
MAQPSQPSTAALSAYIILPISLPPLPAFPKPATHYLYLRPDTPRTPTADTPRSVFASNVPVDACEQSFRTLFKQIGGRIERVQFEDDEERARRRGSGILVKGEKIVDTDAALAVGKKRKRISQEDDDGDLQDLLRLPETWETRARKSGSNAVIVFVDKATADAVLKECKKLAKKGPAAAKGLVWRPVGDWGEKRKCSTLIAN